MKYLNWETGCHSFSDVTRNQKILNVEALVFVAWLTMERTALRDFSTFVLGCV